MTDDLMADLARVFAANADARARRAVATLDAMTKRERALFREAADVAQRIVDEIGHPVTDEPALGPSYREQIAAMRPVVDAAEALYIAEGDPTDLKAFDAVVETYLTNRTEAGNA